MNKRLISLLLAVLMLLTLAACKTVTPAETNEATGVESTAAAESIPGVMDVPEGLWEEMVPAEQETVAATEETKAEKETEPKDQTTKPTESTNPDETEATEPSEPVETVTKLTEYEWYNSLSGEEQMAYMETFASMADFFEWYNAAKAEYEELHPSIDIGSGNIDLGDIIGGNG